MAGRARPRLAGRRPRTDRPYMSTRNTPPWDPPDDESPPRRRPNPDEGRGSVYGRPVPPTGEEPEHRDGQGQAPVSPPGAHAADPVPPQNQPQTRQEWGQPQGQGQG